MQKMDIGRMSKHNLIFLRLTGNFVCKYLENRLPKSLNR